MSVVRAPAPAGVGSAPEVYSVAGAETCTITISTVDALSVGMSLRTLARTRLTGVTAEVYERVGKELVAAARLALAESQ